MATDGNSKGAAGTARRYSGLSTAQRAATRRAALIDAGLSAFAQRGYANSTVKGICTAAGLTERYFYESFSDREELLLRVYQEVIALVVSNVQQGIAAAGDDVERRAEAGLGAFITTLLADPRRARVVLVEVVGVSAAMEATRLAVMTDFAQIILSAYFVAPDNEIAALRSIALVGAVGHLLMDTVLTGAERDAETLLGVCLDLFRSAAAPLGSEHEEQPPGSA